MELSPKERFLAVFEFKPPDRIPIFFLDQTGRYIPEVNDILSRTSFLEIAKNPEKAADLTLTAQRTLDVDAILPFSHMMLIVEAMGFKLRWSSPPSIRNREPSVTKPIQTLKDVKSLRTPEPDRDMAYRLEAINLLFKAIGGEIPIIGSIAASFTTSAWIRGVAQLNTDLTENPELVHALQAKITEFLPECVEAQMAAGASLAMIHDWAVGYRSASLTLQQYREFVLPYEQQLFNHLRKRKIPTILWISNTQQVFDGMIESGADVISVDSKTDLEAAKRKTEGKTGLYGNFDPSLLHQNAQTIEGAVKESMRKAAPGRGYIFSTGGRVVRAPIDQVLLMVRLAKRFGQLPIGV